MAIGLIAVIPAVGLFLFEGFRHTGRERALAEKEMLRLASLASIRQERLEHGAEQLLLTLMGSPLAQTGDDHVCSAFLSETVERLPIYATLGRAEADGRVSCSANPIFQEVDLGEDPLFRRAIDERRFVRGRYEIEAISRRPVIPFAQPVIDEEGRVIRVLFASVDLAWLGAFASESSLPDGATITVVDGRRTIVARYPDPDRWTGQAVPEADVVRVMTDRHEGTMQARGVDGVARLYGFTTFGNPDVDALRIAVGVPADVVLADADRSLRLVALGTLAMAVCAAIAAWAGGWFLVVRPVRHLQRVVGRVARGDLSARVGDPAASGELGDLAIAFDEMAASLERHTANVLALNDAVAERSRALADSNKELEAFAYSVSHDLRAPLRAIDGFAQILIDEYREQIPDQARRHLATVRESASTMGRLIDGLLSFSRISRQHVERRSVDPENIVRDVLGDHADEIAERHISVLVDDMPRCMGDPVLLRQVYANLIANAIKFTRSQELPRIHFGSEHEDHGRTVYFVRDNGAGFDMRYVGKLFGVFQRLHRSDEYEGTGVGLATAQKIILRHGGRIWGEAEVGRGATFFFTIEQESER